MRTAVSQGLGPTAVILWGMLLAAVLALPVRAEPVAVADDAETRNADTRTIAGPVTANTSERSWEFGIAVGYGQRSNPLVNSDDLDLYADVDLAWFGERWFFDNGDLGYMLTQGRLVTVNWLARLNSDRLFFTRANGPIGFINAGLDAPLPVSGEDPDEVVFLGLTAEPPDRKWTLESGLEILAEGRWGFMQAAVMHDTLGVHSGYEASISYGYGLVARRWYVEPSVRLSYKSSELNNYYWGLRDSEAPSGVSAYRASDGVNWLARCSAAYRISERWALSLAVEYERLNDEARNSPIVAESEVLGFFAGLGYRF